MSYKSVSSETGAGRANRRKSQLKARKRAAAGAGSPASRRALVVMGIMVIAFCTVGALAAWRGVGSITAMKTASGANATTVPMPGATPPALPPNAPSKEFIYAGSALLATTEAFREAPDDIAVWRRNVNNASTWLILNPLNQAPAFPFGAGADIPITRDFDGDGKTDFCVYRPSNGTWYIVKSSDGAYYSTAFGLAGDDVPTAADYDGDGKADLAVFRPSTGYWYISRSSDNGLTSVFYGVSTDKPESADFDGDGKSDIAVWRNSAAGFFFKRSTDGGFDGCSIGASDDKPTVGDYDGDGKADCATWRPGDGNWRIRYSATNALDTIQLGIPGDMPVQGNYSDGDAKTDLAVWRPSNGVWYIRQSIDGSLRRPIRWGQSGDTPVPAPYKR